MIRNLICALFVVTGMVTIGFILTRKTPLFAWEVTTPERPDLSNRPYISTKAPEPPPLDPAWETRLRERRARQLENLLAYALAGKYPRNLDVPGRAPVFIDDLGTACAVGHMMRASDRHSLADVISLTDNNITIQAIKDGPAMDWILTSGFTQEECAMIQPTYKHRGQKVPRDPPPTPDELVRERLINVHESLVESTERGLYQARYRLRVRLQKGPLPDDCLRDVAVVVSALEPK